MKITVNMNAYNAEATVASALKSLLRQRDAGQLDIVVVDDGSTDRTCEVVAALAAQAPEIRLIKADHGGIPKARNVALRAMAPDTDLVSFLDADDLSPPDRFSRDAALFRSDPTLELVYSRIRFFDREDGATLAPCAGAHSTDGRVVQLGAGVYRRQLLDCVGPFDESFVQGDDLDYLLRIFEQRPKYAISDEIAVYYRRNHGGISEKRLEVRRELMKALFHRRKRRPHLGDLTLPEGIFTTDHMAELRTWAK